MKGVFVRGSIQQMFVWFLIFFSIFFNLIQALTISIVKIFTVQFQTKIMVHLYLLIAQICIILPFTLSKIYNLTAFTPTGILQFKPLASGSHFVANNQMSQGSTYSIIYVSLQSGDVTLLNDSVPEFDFYRSFRSNLPIENHFLMIRNGSLTLESSNFTMINHIYSGEVADMDFGADYDTLYYIRIQNNNSEIMKVTNASKTPISSLITTILNSYAYKLLYQNNKLIVLSTKNMNTTGIMSIIDPDDPSSPEKVNIPGGRTSFVTANDKYILLRKKNSTLNVFNYSGFKVATFGGLFYSCELVNEWIITDQGDGFLTQYNLDHVTGDAYQIQNPYSEINVTLFHSFGYNKAVIYHKRANQTIYLLNVNSTYSCVNDCKSCHKNYHVNTEGQCEGDDVLNEGNISNQTTLNQTTNYTNQNQTYNQTNNTTINETTNETASEVIPNDTNMNNTDPVSNITGEEQPEGSQNSTEEPNSHIDAKSESLVGNLMFVALFRTNFKLLIPIYIFIEDIWPYQFHRDVRYTNFMEGCMNESALLFNLKFQPRFLHGTNAKELALEYFCPMEEKYQSNLRGEQKFKGIQDYEAYFLYSFQDYLFWGVPISFFFYFLNLMLKNLLKKIKGDNRILKALYITFAYKGRKWVIILLFLDSGLFRLSFNAFNQLSIPHSFDFSNKLNLAFSILMLFAIIIYAFTFYMLVKRFHPNSSAILLSLGKEARKGFLLQILTYTSCKIFKSLFHSNLILYHPHKIIGLMVIDLIQIAISIRLRNFFINYSIFLLSVVYNATFFLLNLQIYLNFVQKAFSHDDMPYHLTIKILIFTLIAITVGKALVMLFSEIREICKSLICKNQIQDEGQLEDFSNSRKVDGPSQIGRAPEEEDMKRKETNNDVSSMPQNGNIMVENGVSHQQIAKTEFESEHAIKKTVRKKAAEIVKVEEIMNEQIGEREALPENKESQNKESKKGKQSSKNKKEKKQKKQKVKKEKKPKETLIRFFRAFK